MFLFVFSCECLRVFLVLFLCNLDVLALALVRLAVVQLEDDEAQSLEQEKYKFHKYV